MATREDRSPAFISGETWSQDFARSLSEGRRRAHDFIDAQCRRLDAIETELVTQLQTISEQGNGQQRIGLDQNPAQQEAAAEAIRQREEAIRQNEATIAQREQEIAVSDAALRDAQRQLTIERENLLAEQEQLARTRDRLAAEAETLDTQYDQVAAAAADTKNQRRAIARQFQAQRATQQKQYERWRVEVEQREAECDERVRELTEQRAALEARSLELEDRARHLDSQKSQLAFETTATRNSLEQQLATAVAEGDELRLETARLRNLLNTRGDELKGLRDQTAQLAVEIEGLGQDHDRLSQELAIKESMAGDEHQRAAALVAERDALAQQLADAQSQLESFKGSGSRKKDDLQRRFEMAVDEVREQKRRIADLEEQLLRSNSRPRAAPEPSNGRLDWEAQKRRLLASLEAEFGEDDEESQDQRLTIEGAIRITDQVVAERECEIAELKKMLHAQSSNIGTIAVGAAAIAEILDQDELIRQEREHLKQLQTECSAKLRKAEIDISLERAKIARERSEIEEKVQAFKTSEHERARDETPGEKTSKPTRGRWLTRLGLKDLDE